VKAASDVQTGWCRTKKLGTATSLHGGGDCAAGQMWDGRMDVRIERLVGRRQRRWKLGETFRRGRRAIFYESSLC
jgi:hypothetical protein